MSDTVVLELFTSFDGETMEGMDVYPNQTITVYFNGKAAEFEAAEFLKRLGFEG